MVSKTLSVMAFAASASAHMIMNFPKPFGIATLDSSPLAPADFPCKQRSGVYAISTMNKWNAGETQRVSFNGTAVHSGGSCQFSITTDKEPTKESQWKVIQSNIGGCPANQKGNYPEPKPGDSPLLHPNPDTFPVKMPSNIPSGQYTFAWTWMNAEGNREFYMNCAPIQVGGSSETASTQSAAAALAKLPDMFVANLPNDGPSMCASKALENFAYPNPGENVVYGAHQSNTATGSTLEGAGCVKQNALGAGSGQLGSPSPGTPSTPSQGTTPSQPSSAPSAPPSKPKPSERPASSTGSPSYKGPTESKIPSNPGGGVFAPGASSAPAAGPTAQPNPPVAQPTTLIPKPAPSAAPPAVPETPNNTTPSNGECTPCTNDGAVVCIGSKQFGLCNRGCAVAQDLAAGMACSNGVVVAATKRHLHFPRGHLRRLSAARML
ncbi:hypothetical protein GQ44DRAFT_722106 [Phaeosphaeriaceae sp. PMI808]|nr:hypothetical protein GQ44DRAFT_722106 [Phaeosphaeriaceae sp. PMI808]